nr:aminoglycoside/hydroxyurea antibiotic resistance kinase [uncultured bacterium]
MGSRSLVQMAKRGQDDEATRILCTVARHLHAPRPRPLPELIPLTNWFAELEPQAAIHGGLLDQSLVFMRELFATPQDLVPLHGDIHHENILDAGERGWLAIDPKRLHGERGFDFVNILRNPDPATANLPGRFAHQTDIIVQTANLDRTRFLKWVVAFTGLSAAWYLADGGDPNPDLSINRLALAELGKL